MDVVTHCRDGVRTRGAAASAAGVAEIAVELLDNLVQYSLNVHDAPAQATDLRTEVNALRDVLSSAQQVFERNPEALYRSTIAADLDSLRQMLEKISSRTRPQETSGVGRLVWPIRQAKNVDILSRIQRYKTRD
jgi:hypothetical protein